MLKAKINFMLEVYKDNFFSGEGEHCNSHFEKDIYITFNDKQDLIEKVAEWVSERFDVSESDFIKYNDTEEENRIFYSQNENEKDLHIELTENNPDGYIVNYDFYIEEVSKVIEFNL